MLPERELVSFGGNDQEVDHKIIPTFHSGTSTLAKQNLMKHLVWKAGGLDATHRSSLTNPWALQAPPTADLCC